MGEGKQLRVKVGGSGVNGVSEVKSEANIAIMAVVVAAAGVVVVDGQKWLPSETVEQG